MSLSLKDLSEKLRTAPVQELSQYIANFSSVLEAQTNNYNALLELVFSIDNAIEEIDKHKNAKRKQTGLLSLNKELYAQGSLNEERLFLVELGTNYFAEKSANKAVAALTRRKEFVRNNSRLLQEELRTTRSALELARRVFAEKTRTAQMVN